MYITSSNSNKANIDERYFFFYIYKRKKNRSLRNDIYKREQKLFSLLFFLCRPLHSYYRINSCDPNAFIVLGRDLSLLNLLKHLPRVQYCHVKIVAFSIKIFKYQSRYLSPLSHNYRSIEPNAFYISWSYNFYNPIIVMHFCISPLKSSEHG